MTIEAFTLLIGAAVTTLVAILFGLRRKAERIQHRSPTALHKRPFQDPTPTSPLQHSSAYGAPNGNLGIFISYRRDDEPHLAGRLNDRIVAEFGRARVFMDIDSVGPGSDFIEVINNALQKCQVLLVLMGGKWIDASDARGKRRLDDSNDYVRLEVESALTRGIPVIPVLVEGVRMPHMDELPERMSSLARRSAVEISHGRFDADANRVIEALRRVVT
jgi:hypothetical protein